MEVRELAMTARDEMITAEMVDVSDMTLADMRDCLDPEVLAAKQRLLARIDNPKSSFGGYNPQRES